MTARTEAPPQTAELDPALRELAAVASELDADRLAAEACALAERVTEGRFYVACVGQFKRGKSSLLDALVGDPVLPIGILPVTAVPTVVRHGPGRAARVQLGGGVWREVPLGELDRYVSEEFNPENAKGVTGVEVFLPSPLLAGGMCFVDTPGVGSVFGGNTAATRAFIPHVDAVLVVLGADPPVSGEELALVEDVSRHVQRIIVVLNKADRATDAERAAAEAFAARILSGRLGRPVGPIYEVSARERLDGVGPERDWPALVGALTRLAEESGRSLVRTAHERGVRRIAQALRARIEEERTAHLCPTEETERRVARMAVVVSDAERSLDDLGALLGVEQQRLAREFATRREQFLNRTLPEARADLAVRTRSMDSRGRSFRREAMRAAQEIAEQRVRPWLEAEASIADEAYRRATARFVDLARGFLGRMPEDGDAGLAALAEWLDAEQHLRAPSRFRFNPVERVAADASPFRAVADAVRGAFAMRRRIERDALAFLDWLLVMNSSRVEHDLAERVRESRRRLEAEIRSLLAEVRRSAERSLARARAAHDAGAAAVEAALDRLERLEARVQRLSAGQ